MSENERLKALRAKEEEDKELVWQARADEIIDKLSERYPHVDAAVIRVVFDRGYGTGYDEGFSNAYPNW